MTAITAKFSALFGETSAERTESAYLTAIGFGCGLIGGLTLQSLGLIIVVYFGLKYLKH